MSEPGLDETAVADPEVTPLTEPADGVPDIVDTPAQLARTVEAFSAGTGPVAVDAERASGYRYGQSTYLVQMRRAGAGTVLIDPVALPDLSTLNEVIVDAEWVFHAASQDLPGLREQGLIPSRIFDTELAARLLGLDRVGLGAVVQELLGLSLAKEHSAVDWSTRPLPEAWLKYAALDVELLVELRGLLMERLVQEGKEHWAEQEFEAVRLSPGPKARVEPWRRVSGSHSLRQRRQLAVVRELWHTREDNAQRRDIAPGRVLRDRAIIAAATALPRNVGALTAVQGFSGKSGMRRAALWQGAIDRALALGEADLPTLRGPRSDGPPPPRAWADRNPAAAARLTAAREFVTEIHADVGTPVENLLQPDLLRRVCWEPPVELTSESLAERLLAGGARPWQIELLRSGVLEALSAEPEPDTSENS